MLKLIGIFNSPSSKLPEHKLNDRLWVTEIFFPMLTYFFVALENIFYGLVFEKLN